MSYSAKLLKWMWSWRDYDPYTIRILSVEMNDWISENIAGKWYLFDAKNIGAKPRGMSGVFIIFENESDYLAFKLRWL